MQIIRTLSMQIPPVSEKGLQLITGARQTGKTTLVKQHYPKLSYYNLDAPEYREQLSNISSFRWGHDVGTAVFDEIQKKPDLLDKIKFAYDEESIHFSVITGSSQIMLLKKVRESLAGRVHILELFPLMLSELCDPDNSKKGSPLLELLLRLPDPVTQLQELPSVLLGNLWDNFQQSENHLLKWGGMPALIHYSSEKRKMQWIRDYSVTYLERDMADMARLPDLFAYAKFQRLAALRSGNLLSYAELARDAGISIETARRYFEYLRVSYQAILLQPYQKNLTSSTIRTPKVYWMDNGLLRHISGLGFELQSGALYENYIASELIKWLRTTAASIPLTFYRTRSGMEIDFLLETSTGIVLLEAKNRETVSESDFASMRQTLAATSENIKAAVLIYRGNEIKVFNSRCIALPSCRLFGEKV